MIENRIHPWPNRRPGVSFCPLGTVRANMRFMYRALLLLLIGSLACSPRSGEPGLNLLLVTIDTLRQDAVGAYGDQTARTPHLDRLARNGILFTSAQTAVPTTLASHATLFTGLYPASHGVRHNGRILPDESNTLAERLGARGYRTGAFVGSLVLHRSFRIDQGFETFDDDWGRGDGAEMGLHGQWERSAHRVTDAFLEWLDLGERKTPWFGWVHYYDPHAPYKGDGPAGKAASSDYGAEVFRADRELGRILRELESTGELDHTIVIVLSDHGEGLGAHDESEHGLLLFETTLAIPWIIRLPNGSGPVLVDWPAETVDFLPTVAELLSLPREKEWQGKSLVPGIRGEPPDPDRPLYAESYYGYYGYGWAPLHSVRSGDWKLVEGTRRELFHLGRDPHELHDLVETERAEATRLGRMLKRVREAQPTMEEEKTEADLSEEQKNTLEALGYVTPKKRTQKDVRSDPRDTHLAHELTITSRSHYLAGRLEQAKTGFLEALRIDPVNVDVMIRLADCYRDEGNQAQEESLYVRILTVDPTYSPAWNNLGTIVENRSDTLRAAECYQKAIDADSGFAHAWLNRGNLRIETGNYEGAWSDLEKAAELDPSLALAHYGKARILQWRKEYASVVRELKLALRYDPELKAAEEWLQALERAYNRGELGDAF